MFEFLKTSLTPDSDAYCAAISAAGALADPSMDESYLLVRISKSLVIQQSRVCTSEKASGMMRCE